MIITRPRGRREYVLKSERDKPVSDQTIFLLDDLTERDRVKVMDSLRVGVEDGLSMTGTGTRVYTTCAAGLRGWRNLRDSDGGEVDYKSTSGGRPTDDSLGLLPWDVKVELTDAILESAFPSEEDKEK